MPTIFFVEAKLDTITSLHHVEMLSKRLSVTDNTFVHLRVSWARHGFDAVTFGLGAQLVQYHLDGFLTHTFYVEQP